MNTPPGHFFASIPFDLLTQREQTAAHTCGYRLSLYNRGLPCGPEAIQREFHADAISPVPSTSKISRILRRYHLTHQRTGYYQEDY